MRRAGVAATYAIAVLGLPNSGIAQSLEQTAIFIVKGVADPKLRETPEGIVVEAPSIGGTAILKKMAPERCVFELATKALNGDVLEQKFFFNHVSREDLTEGPQAVGGRIFRSVTFRGTKDIYCTRVIRNGREIRRDCFKTWSIDSDLRGDYHRVPKAVSYLYDKFCTGLTDRGAF